MLRALSTRGGRSPWEYRQLVNDETSSDAEEVLVPKLSRARTLPAKILNYSRKLTDATVPAASKKHNDQVKKASKVHPFFSLFDMSQKRRKKATAKPEVSRYLEYMREGGGVGIWDMKAEKPVVG